MGSHLEQSDVQVVFYVLESILFAGAGLLLSCLFSALIVTVLWAARSLAQRQIANVSDAIPSAFVAAAVSFLALVVGYFAGASRDAAAPQLITAAFGVIGTIGGFLGLHAGKNLQVGLILMPFTMSLFVGALTGAKIREGHEIYGATLPAFEELKREARREYDIKQYREKLGLPWPPEHWTKPD